MSAKFSFGGQQFTHGRDVREMFTDTTVTGQLTAMPTAENVQPEVQEIRKQMKFSHNAPYLAEVDCGQGKKYFPFLGEHGRWYDVLTETTVTYAQGENPKNTKQGCKFKYMPFVRISDLKVPEALNAKMFKF